ncbi:MAG: hypothetical protein Q9162_007332 [Coniocarpon cinnabarinum]
MVSFTYRPEPICGPPMFEEQVRRAVSLYEPDIRLDTADFLLDETARTRDSQNRYYHEVQRRAERTALSLDLSREDPVPLTQMGTALGGLSGSEETLVDRAHHAKHLA